MKKGLGKGLGALIGESEINNDKQSIEIIKISQIEPNNKQPRKNFNDEKIIELSKSIIKHGIIQPIIVKKEGQIYKIIAGERRWRASRLAGIKEIPCLVKDYTDKEIMQVALIENIQREDLNAIEEASAYDRLLNEYNLTHDELSDIVGRSRPYITNSIRLLNLYESVKQMLIEGVISNAHARCLVGIKDENIQIKIARDIEDNQLSVRQTEALIKSLATERNGKKIKSSMSPELMCIQDNFQDVFGTKVKIKDKNNKGKIMIEYYSNEELERIIDLINRIKSNEQFTN